MTKHKQEDKEKIVRIRQYDLFVALVIAFLLGAVLASTALISLDEKCPTVQEPVKAKVWMLLGNETLCVDSELTIEEWYFQAKLFASMGRLNELSPICN